MAGPRAGADAVGALWLLRVTAVAVAGLGLHQCWTVCAAS